MKLFKTTVGALALFLLIISTVRIMAEPHTPENTRVGIEFRLSSAQMEVLVNGVPLFSPTEGLEMRQTVNTGLDFNTSVQAGRNTVTLRLKTLENDGGWDRAARVRVLHWPAGFLPNFMSSDVPFLADVELVTREDGTLTVSSTVGTQTSAQAFPVTFAPQAVAQGEWITITIPFELDMPFPQPLWQSAAQPLGTSVSVEELLVEYRHIHSGASLGQNGLFRALEPMMNRAGDGYGWTGERFFDHAFGVLYDDERQFALQPVETIGQQVRILGDGRLATLTPGPLTFLSGLTDETAELWLYFWKDQSGQWRLMQ
ncbi:hypothetical protein [Tritonibacter scottomollicae]|uniref:hypothetical protein n=1 Tax=Tritonibacter scottomollicae TaxID=483013 RepID=UPI003AA859C8